MADADVAQLEFERDAALEAARNYRASLQAAEERWYAHFRDAH